MIDSMEISMILALALLLLTIHSIIKYREVNFLKEENIKLKICIEQVKAQEKAASEMQAQMKETFKALSHDALKSNRLSFLEIAEMKFQQQQEGLRSESRLKQQAIESLVKPLSLSLEKVNEKIHLLEKGRASAFSTLQEQIKSLNQTHTLLQNETKNLVKALRTPHVRGRWGEIQLKRVVEIAGMVEHCDFSEQKAGGESLLRPDMIIHLPEDKKVIVDAKTPLFSYLEAIEETDEAKSQIKLQEHAKQLKNHMLQLSQKAYWSQFDQTPEFVVLFLPGEPIFSAALQQDPEIIEWGAKRHVIIATPTTLISLLKSISYGWRQEGLAENARQIGNEGKILYERLLTFSNHFSDIRRGLEKTVDSFNQSVASFEARLVPSAKKLSELGVKTTKTLPETKSVEKVCRKV